MSSTVVEGEVSPPVTKLEEAQSGSAVIDPVATAAMRPAAWEAVIGDVAPSLVVVATLPLGASVSSSEPERKGRAKSDLDVSGIPSFLSEAGAYGPHILKKLAMTLGGADKALKYLCSAMRKVGFSAKPGYKVTILPLGSSSPQGQVWLHL